MLKKLLLKIALPFVVGLVIGIVYAAKGAPWYLSLIAPIYAVGFVYGITKVGPYILKFLGSMLKAAGSLFLFRLFFWIILIILIIPIGLAVLLGVCWIAGFPLAIVDLIECLKCISLPERNRKTKVDYSDDDDDDDYYGNDDDDDDYDDF